VNVVREPELEDIEISTSFFFPNLRSWYIVIPNKLKTAWLALTLVKTDFIDGNLYYS
jgi:hypothetical protein